jgi:pyridinium-3,5-bisthiocarboxylic acid mononucleotide nickel chelatase
MHNEDHHHTHEHSHDHENEHSHEGAQAHHHDIDGHENLLQSKDEAAAFLQYTLHHNAHHEEELSGLAHSLEHLLLSSQAQEVQLAIQDIDRANKRLENVLAALK